MNTNEPMTDGRLAEARAALDEDMSQRGGEYGADLLAEVERLRNDLAKAREVTDDMIERAAVQMCSNGRNATIWANYLYEDERESFREDARAALDAALNPGEGS